MYQRSMMALPATWLRSFDLVTQSQNVAREARPKPDSPVVVKLLIDPTRQGIASVVNSPGVTASGAVLSMPTSSRADSPPTNDPLLPALMDCIQSRRCVAIIGAGVSWPDYPLGKELGLMLLEACGVRNEDLCGDTLEHFSEVAKAKNADAYFAKLDALFASTVAPKSARRYHMLARIPFTSVISLNFDCLLSDVFDLHTNIRIATYPHVLPTRLDSEEGEKVIHYLHGRLGPGRPAVNTSIVLTRTEFEAAYDQPASRLPDLLRDVFFDHDVCFLGCDPRQSDIKRILAICEAVCQSTHGLEDHRRPRRFLLWDDGSDEPTISSETGIHLVRYPRSGDSFAGFDAMLEWLAGRKVALELRPGVDRYDANIGAQR